MSKLTTLKMISMNRVNDMIKKGFRVYKLSEMFKDGKISDTKLELMAQKFQIYIEIDREADLIYIF